MKKLLSFLLSLMMIFSMSIGAVGMTASAAEPAGKVGQVSKMAQLVKTSKALDKMPRTFEAVIKLPTTYKDRAGVIFGNYKDGSNVCISFEVNAGGVPRLYYQDANKKTYNHVFTGVDIRSDGEPVRLTLVQDPTAKTVTCYINGEEKLAVAATSLPDEIIPTNPQVVGGDLRGDNAQFFKGTIYQIRVYSDVLTADQVKAGQGTGLLASYDFTAATNQSADLSGNGYDLTGKLNLQDIYSVSADEPAKTEGMEFTSASRYQTGEDGVTKVPYTYSAWIYLPKSTVDRGGVIFGNYKDNSMPSFSMEIYSDGVPRFYQLSSGKATSFTFPNADVRTGDWAHLAFTVTDVVTCYLNGKNVGESAVFAYDEIPFEFPLCVGGDLRNGNSQYFKGRIKEIALFAEVLTAANIETLYQKGAAAVGKELIAHYDLSSVKAGEDFKDTTGNGNTVFADPRFFTDKDPVGEYAYSFAFVGDTQIVTEKYPDQLAKIYDWLLANKDAKKIEHVFGLGDITNKDTDQEWAVALSQISKLDGKIPYSLVRGNHDSVAKFNGNFSTDVYRKQFEGFYQDGILNTWRTFKAGQTDYLLVTLDYGASDDVLNWAGEAIAAHPEHRVIITTHAYFFRDGTTLGANDVCPPATTGGYNNGDDIWKKLISKYENIVLVVSGHDPCENIVSRQAKGEHGNTVTQVLIDPQGVDAASGATGMVAMFYFSEDGNSIEVECYSTVREKFFLAENQFKITIPQTEKKPETTPAPETTQAPETTAAPADTDAPAVTTAPAPAAKDGGAPVGIIVAAAVVVVAAAVVGVIIAKKKKKA